MPQFQEIRSAIVKSKYWLIAGGAFIVALVAWVFVGFISVQKLTMNALSGKYQAQHGALNIVLEIDQDSFRQVVFSPQGRDTCSGFVLIDSARGMLYFRPFIADFSGFESIRNNGDSSLAINRLPDNIKRMNRFDEVGIRWDGGDGSKTLPSLVLGENSPIRFLKVSSP